MINPYSIKLVTLPGPGYMAVELSSEELDPIKKEIKKISSNFNNFKKANHKLAGNIKKEYVLEDSRLHQEKFIVPLIDKYIDHFKYKQYNRELQKIFLKDTWVNFQKKHEFNPLHDHEGMFSYVIWINIPYTEISERKMMPEVPVGTLCSGFFAFHYVNALGEMECEGIPADKKFEGKMLLFPSKLHHIVYPFYSSDDYRISVSGNFYLTNKNASSK